MNVERVYNEFLDSTMTKYYYESLRKKVYSMLNFLKESVNLLDDIDDKIISNYTIDDSSVYNVLIRSEKDKLTSRINYLSFTVIPALNSKICD